ncbi:Mu transposase C-terminal domain-containing protein [Gorillibacterium massiliense]|uniref:Mu transposase C-terminal domain-containing protein n=1 Tax=Gorillibacterium massiliense TaxID=1280390 RepID=UPI00059430AB|nr:Mu transposase C-terminal domain-containing protein [Gorillibacterium massiliense]
MNNEAISLGLANVTGSGIFFKGLYYSTAEAIKGRWFEHAGWIGGWPVIVAYDPKNMNSIFIVNEKNHSLTKCNSINPHSEYGEKLEKYFKSIQMLKMKHFARRKRKMPNSRGRHNDLT